MKFPALIAAFCFLGKLSAQHGALFRAAGSNEATEAGNFALANNPGRLHREKQQAGGWMQQRFTGTELVHGGMAWSGRFGQTAIGADASYRGTQHFNQSSVHLSAGQNFSKQFSAGFSAGYTGYFQSSEYGRRGRLTGKIGAALRINDRWDAAAVLIDPWTRQDDFFASGPAAALALGYQVNNITRIWGHYRYSEQFPPVYGLTLRHAPAKDFQLVASVQTGYEPVSAGLEYSRSGFRLSFSTAYHTYLGFSPAFSLLWSVN